MTVIWRRRLLWRSVSPAGSVTGEALSSETRRAEPSGLLQIFVVFARISLTSFGGGLSGWMMRDLVQSRRWLSESEFLAGLALAQAFPGVNVVNLSIWIGYRLRGGAGALAGVCGMVLPAMVVAVAVVSLLEQAAGVPVVHRVLAGIAAAAIGLSLQMGVRAARRAATSTGAVAVMAATFMGIYGLGLPLLTVVAVMAPLSIAAAFYRLRQGEAARE